MYRSINLLGPPTGEYCKIEQNYQNRGGGGFESHFGTVVRASFLKHTIYTFSKKGGGLNVYLEGLKKEAIRAAHPYSVIYR